MRSLQNAHVQNIYRPVSIIFGVLVVLLIGSVAYTGWSSTVITVTPKIVKVTASFPITIGPTSGQDTLPGTIQTETKTASVTVTPKSVGDPVPAHATGTVTIKNTTSTVQPLAAGTRLKSDSGIIVRTTARVDVPAGGNVTAKVIADPLGETGNLAPGKFTIVALWPGLQTKIYGESTDALTGGLAAGGATLSLDELTAASNQAEEQVRSQAGASRPGLFISLDPGAVTSTPKPEVPSTSYTVTVSMNVTTVTYSAADLSKTVSQELTKLVVADQTLKSQEEPALRIDEHPTADSVVLHVEATGSSQLTSTSQLFQPAGFTGLSADDVQKKLNDASTVKSVVVKLSPFWRTSTPDQANRITVVVNPARP